MKNILIIFLVLLIISCAPKTYNAPFVNSEEIVRLEFGMSKDNVLFALEQSPLYVKNGNSQTSVWVYNVRTIQVKSGLDSDGITVVAAKTSDSIKHQAEIDNLYLTFDIDDNLLAWGDKPYDPEYIAPYYDCEGVCNGDAYIDECGECIASSSKESQNKSSNDGSFKLELNVEGTQEPDGTLIIKGGE